LITSALEAAEPVRCISVAEKAPLLTAPPGIRSDLELRHRGTPADRKRGEHADAAAWQVLADPRVLTLELVSRSRQDIPSEAYDDH